MREKHDAILIATGVYKAREIKIPGSHLKNITTTVINPIDSIGYQSKGISE